MPTAHPRSPDPTSAALAPPSSTPSLAPTGAAPPDPAPVGEPLPSSPAVACVTCGAAIAAHYCAECGERRADERPRTAHELLAEAWDALTSVDGRLLRSLATLVRRPGALTAAHLRGERQRWVGPLRLFLIANLAYFAVAGALSMHTFTTPLGTHLTIGMTPHTDVARRLVVARLGERRVTYRAYRDRFDAAYATRSRSLLVLLVPMIAVGAALVGHRRRPLAAHHVVFAFHLVAAVLLFQLVEHAVVDLPLRPLLRALGLAGNWRVGDSIGATVSAAVIGAYSALALRRAYGFGRRGAAFGALALVIVWFAAIQLYRTLLFFLTFWTT